ncbi:hypothetical protein [Azospirillum doebereinerae]
MLAWEPGHASAWNLLGILRFRLGRPGSVPSLLRAARLSPLAAEAFLTNVLAAGPDAVSAMAGARHLLALQPASAMAFERMAVSAQGEGALDAAATAMERAVRIDVGHAQNRLNLGFLLQGAGRLDGAVSAIRRLLALEPGNAAGLAALGGLRLALGMPGVALPAFRRALRLDPSRSEPAQAITRIEGMREASPLSVPPSAPDGLFVRGPLNPVSGYGHMTCRFLERLVGRPGRPVRAAGVFGPERWPGAEGPVRARVALHFLIPPAVEPLPGARNLVFSMFEGTRIPPAWGRFSARHDLVAVPCEASRRAWMACGYPEERLRICPLGVDPAPPSGAPLAVADRRGRPVASYRHRILNVSDFIPRKNVDGLLRVWLRATRADDDAVLVVKLGKGSAESHAAIEALLARTERAIGRRWEQAAALAVVDRRLEEAEMDGLFRASTAYWSLSHGEGWDLPLTKAGALGLGLIAPRHSAYEDYLDDTVARMIPARAEPARMPYGDAPWAPFHGLDWWVPDEDAAAQAIVDLLRGQGAPLPDARPRLLGRFTWTQATARLETILDEAADL